jgi:DNA-binding GntR family transcriptional regulator
MKAAFGIVKQQVHEQVYESIKNAILNGELKPGTKLTQDELAAKYQISRMPIRDALRILANEKLVENIPNRGFTVSHYKDDELQDTLFLRSILEREAVKLAAGRLTDADIESMEDLMERMDGCIRRNRLGRLPRLNSEFHFTLYNASPSRQLLEFVGKLWDRFPRYAMLATRESALVSQKHHARILESLKKGDYAKAGSIMEEHILTTYTNYTPR